MPGTRYLRWLMERYQKRRNSINHVIAAYNAGPAMVDRYRGIPPFRETRMYVARVLGFLKQFSLSGKRDAAHHGRGAKRSSPTAAEPSPIDGRLRKDAHCAAPVSVPWNFDAGTGVRAPNLRSSTAFLSN